MCRNSCRVMKGKAVGLVPGKYQVTVAVKMLKGMHQVYRTLATVPCARAEEALKIWYS